MLCPNCRNDTPTDKMYCEFCGHALDLDYGKVEESFAAEAEEQLEEETEDTFRGIFLMALFVLGVVICGRMLVPYPEEPRGIGPIYVPDGIAEEAPAVPSRAGRRDRDFLPDPERTEEEPADLDRVRLEIPGDR